MLRMVLQLMVILDLYINILKMFQMESWIMKMMLLVIIVHKIRNHTMQMNLLARAARKLQWVQVKSVEVSAIYNPLIENLPEKLARHHRWAAANGINLPEVTPALRIVARVECWVDPDAQSLPRRSH